MKNENNSQKIEPSKRENLSEEEIDLLINKFPNKRAATEKNLKRMRQKAFEAEVNNQKVDRNKILKELNLEDIAIAAEDDVKKWEKQPAVVFKNMANNKQEKLAVFQRIKELEFEIEKIIFDELLEELDLKNVVKISVESSNNSNNEKYILIKDYENLHKS